MPEPIDWHQVAAEYRAGATFAQLGRRWGRDPSGIRTGLIRAGVQLENGHTHAQRARRAATAERHAQVRRLYELGRSSDEIANATGYTPSYVRELTGASKWREKFSARDERVIQTYLAGHTISQTAKLTGTARTQVGRIVQRAGVARPRGPRPARKAQTDNIG